MAARIAAADGTAPDALIAAINDAASVGFVELILASVAPYVRCNPALLSFLALPFYFAPKSTTVPSTIQKFGTRRQPNV